MEPCARYTELLSARLDGELTVQEEGALEAHLARCPQCRALAEELETIHAAFPQLEEIPAPEGFAQGVMERIRGEASPKVVPLFRRPQFKALAGLAACALLCVGLYQAGLPKTAMENQESMVMSRSMAEDVAQPTEAVGYAVEEPEAVDGDSDGAVSPPYDPGDDGAPRDAHVQYTMTTAVQETQDLFDAKTSAPAHYAFYNDQYLRVSWREGLDTSTAVILGSTGSLADYLAQFPENDLSALTARYGEDFFQTGRLLALVVTEPSGSNRHQLAFQGLLWDQVTVERQVPEAGDCDMAAWLILAELDAAFEDGHTLNVILQ